MQALFLKIMQDSDLPAILAAVIALFGVVISVLVSALISRRSMFVNSVTVERSKWIEKLRSNLANFYAQTSRQHFDFLVDGPRVSKEDDGRSVLEIERLAALIRLQLNPRGEIDRNLITLLGTIPHMMATGEDGPFGPAQDLLIRHSQWLLKEEWEKVKAESSGPLHRLLARARERKRRKEYKTFCKSEVGSLNVVRSFKV